MKKNIFNKFSKLMEAIRQYAELFWSYVTTPLVIIFLGSILSAVGALLFAIKQEQDSRKNEELQSKINEQSQETLNTITSRGSFGYILLVIKKNVNGQNGNNAEFATITFVHTGKYPIRNVEISIVNTDEEAQRGTYNKSDFNEDPKQYNKVGFPYRQKVTVLVPKQKIRLPDIPMCFKETKKF